VPKALKREKVPSVRGAASVSD